MYRLKPSEVSESCICPGRDEVPTVNDDIGILGERDDCINKLFIIQVGVR
jgi:hypothetical protein